MSLWLTIVVVVRFNEWLPRLAVEVKLSVGVLLNVVVCVGLLSAAAVTVLPEVEGWISSVVKFNAFWCSIELCETMKSVGVMSRFTVSRVPRNNTWVLPGPSVEFSARLSFVSDIPESVLGFTVFGPSVDSEVGLWPLSVLQWDVISVSVNLLWFESR